MKNNFADGDNKLVDQLLQEDFLPNWLTSNSKKYQLIYPILKSGARSQNESNNSVGPCNEE